MVLTVNHLNPFKELGTGALGKVKCNVRKNIVEDTEIGI